MGVNGRGQGEGRGRGRGEGRGRGRQRGRGKEGMRSSVEPPKDKQLSEREVQ